METGLFSPVWLRAATKASWSFLMSAFADAAAGAATGFAAGVGFAAVGVGTGLATGFAGAAIAGGGAAGRPRTTGAGVGAAGERGADSLEMRTRRLQVPASSGSGSAFDNPARQQILDRRSVVGPRARPTHRQHRFFERIHLFGFVHPCSSSSSSTSLVISRIIAKCR